MNTNEPTSVTGPRFRLEAGLPVLEQWAEKAGQAQKNSVYKALFRVIDGSVFRECVVLGDVARSDEFSIMVKEDLIVRFSLLGLDSFALHYIGPAEAPADLDVDINRAA